MDTRYTFSVQKVFADKHVTGWPSISKQFFTLDSLTFFPLVCYTLKKILLRFCSGNENTEVVMFGFGPILLAFLPIGGVMCLSVFQRVR